MLGKISFGVRRMASPPLITIDIASTMKVYGLRKARSTIHIDDCQRTVLPSPSTTAGGLERRTYLPRGRPRHCCCHPISCLRPVPPWTKTIFLIAGAAKAEPASTTELAAKTNQFLKRFKAISNSPSALNRRAWSAFEIEFRIPIYKKIK